MNKTNEQNFIFELIKLNKSNETNEQNISEYLNTALDYPWILGQILFNRVGGIAYITLRNLNLLGRINREFRNSLKNIFEIQKIKSEAFKNGLGMLSDIFENADFKYAFLKGAFLIQSLYSEGQRVSNDYDILISPDDLSKIDVLLKNNGFVQGKWDYNKMEIINPTRYELLNSRMNRGETIPYLKKVNITGMDFIEVDVNFSLDHKAFSDNENLNKMLENVNYFDTNNKRVFTLSKEDFFIYLCIHLYKEASIFNWVKMQRDLSLYKFCDIYLYFMQEIKDSDLESLIEAIKEYGLEKECYYCMFNTGIIYNNAFESEKYNYLIKTIEPQDTEFMKTITYPERKTQYKYDSDFVDWLFKYDRVSSLKEWGN